MPHLKPSMSVDKSRMEERITGLVIAMGVTAGVSLLCGVSILIVLYIYRSRDKSHGFVEMTHISQPQSPVSAHS
jgi:hypothetical protein